jgi:hypothetical protein
MMTRIALALVVLGMVAPRAWADGELTHVTTPSFCFASVTGSCSSAWPRDTEGLRPRHFQPMAGTDLREFHRVGLHRCDFPGQVGK